MSQISMTIADSRRAIHGQPHGSSVDYVLAALGAEPETIEELQAALARFPDRVDDMGGWGAGVCEEPFDAGICIVDLAARLIVCDSTYSLPAVEGEVRIPGRREDSECWISYRLPEDWLISEEVDAWRHLSESRRTQLAARPPSDAREVLYGRVSAFVAGECLGARNPPAPPGEWSPPEGWTLRELPERLQPGAAPTAADAIAEIHARWLMTPREDLGGRSPREVLLARREWIERDLQSRSEQWSVSGKCPPGLDPASAAYRFGGFGTHENIVYYDLVRRLVEECWNRVVEDSDASAQAEGQADLVRCLEEFKERWLSKPDFEDYSGQAPGQVIGNERQRVPWAVTAEEAMADDDCPLCQMLGDSQMPGFWCLDGCNHDDDFPFSFDSDRAEWEEERRRWEESAREWEEERARRRAAGLPEDDGSWSGGPSEAVWKRSFSQIDPANDPPTLVLFGIGSHLSELVADLKATPEAAGLVPAVNRQFANIQAALDEGSGSLVEPVVSRFCEELQGVASQCPELGDKCADLERMLVEFAAQLADEQQEPDLED